MKKIFLFFCFMYSINSFTQESIFFFKKDTLLITYNVSLLNKNVLKEYEKTIDNKTKANIGIITSYNLLDFSEEKRKKETMEYLKAHPGTAMHGASPIHFGLHFTHGTVRNKMRNIKEDPAYKIFKKHHLEKDKVAYEDSLAFDNYVFHTLFRRYKAANTSLMFSEKELKNKQVIHFEGKTEAYNKIKELSKTPIYIYILESKTTKKRKVRIDKKRKTVKEKYFIFNEVVLIHAPIIR